MPAASFRSPARAARSSLVRLRDSGDESPVGVELVFEMGAGELQRERERDESLLGAVVQVALEPAPLSVAGGDDPHAGGAQVGELREQLGVQALVIEREAGARGDLVDQSRVIEQARPVGQQRDLDAVAHERCGRVARRRAAARRRRRSGRPRAGRRAADRGRRGCGRAPARAGQGRERWPARRPGARAPPVSGARAARTTRPPREQDERGGSPEPQPPIERIV